MSNRIIFELNQKGVRDLLKSNEIGSVLSQYARNVQVVCGDGYTISSYTGRNRKNVSIHASTKKARKENLRNNTLLKALGSSKG